MDNPFQKKKVLIEVLRDFNEDEKEHFHQEFELLYVLEGGLTVCQDGQQTALQAHDILIINSGKPHALQGTEEILYLKLSIQYAMIADVADAWEVSFWCDSTRKRDDAFQNLEALLRRLLARYLGNQGNTADFLHISLCYQILDFLCAHFLVRDSGAVPEDGADKYEARTRQIRNYILSNYAGSISIKELSEKLYLSPGYLSRFFHRNFGMGFNDYLTKIRLHHAMDGLRYSEEPITRIAYDSGFANVTIFNKAFKDEYGETPSQVRKRAGKPVLRADEPLSEETVRCLKNALWQESDPLTPDKKTELAASFSAQRTVPLRPIWNRVVNIGSANDLLRSRIQEHVIALGKAFGFSYIRFWNPFSREMLIDPSQTGRYNFTRLDAVFDFLLDHAMKPFVELGAKPRRVQAGANQALFLEETEPIASPHDWARLLEAFLRHAIKRYGRAAVEEWKFELWMNYDDIFDEEKTTAFVERFRVTQDIVHKLLEHAEIGGCGMHGHTSSMDQNAPYLDRLRKKILAAGCVPDFVSIYIFPYDSVAPDGSILSRRSSDKDFVRHCVEEFHRAAPEIRARGVRLYVTEWNLTLSDRNWLNDTCFKGAYLLRNYIDLLGKVDCLAYFEGSDRISEFYDTNDCLFGGVGLLTKDSVRKPAGFAFLFLDRLYAHLVGKGENYLISSDGHGSFGIVCHNARELGYSYYMEPEDALDREHLPKYFEDLDPLSLRLTLTDVEDGAYQMKVYSVNKDSGSVLHIWGELDFEPDLSRDDARYLQKVCEPRLTIHSLSAQGGRLHISITMQANEIAYLHVSRRV